MTTSPIKQQKTVMNGDSFRMFWDETSIVPLTRGTTDISHLSRKRSARLQLKRRRNSTLPGGLRKAFESKTSGLTVNALDLTLRTPNMTLAISGSGESLFTEILYCVETGDIFQFWSRSTVYPLRGRWQDASRKESNNSFFEPLTGGDSVVLGGRS